MTHKTKYVQIDLDERMARKIISVAIAEQSNVYVINTKTNLHHKLAIGQLQSIQNHIPQKVTVYFEEPNFILYGGKPVNSNSQQMISYLDLWFEETFYTSFLATNGVNYLDIDADSPNYPPELDAAHIVYRAAINDKRTGLTMKQKTTEIVEVMYPDFSEEAKKRIIMITNTTEGKKAGRKKII